ncbi:hypothetical protein ABI582_19205 [Pseudomonas sp. SAS7]|uniref:helix-turn-helix domain-containing protein n=1 Tax=Pseudomonas sp. SAS7 TaxID=3156487 RepID=UPI003F956351
MLTRETLAAVIRAIRLVKGLTREDLNGCVGSTNLHKLENGTGGITVDTLQRLSTGLGVAPTTLLVLASSHPGPSSTETEIEKIREELVKLDSLGISTAVTQQFEAGKLIPHLRGRKANNHLLEKILALKSQGKTQKEVIEILGAPQSTVNRLWRK